MNDDAVLEDVEHGVFAVADGLGGSRSGGVASRLAVETLRSNLRARPAGAAPEVILKALRTSFAEANAAILAAAGGGRNMLTTLTAVVIDADILFLGHSGDSRAYLVAGDSVEQLTEDHTLVGDLVRQGLMSEAAAQEHPRRSILSGCLGRHEKFKVQTLTRSLDGEQVVILCTDGISASLSEAEIAACAQPDSTAASVVERLVESALRRGRLDDMSAVVIKVL